jgi:16S rRNA (adenine1518-N6/adenine1519-N6)-dimethyltransferase
VTHPPRRKRFGQHFLAETWARKVAAAVDPRPGDVFLEIGPGTGALTLPLAESGCPILAVEIDRDLVAALAPRVPANVTVLSGDVLTTDVAAFLTGLQPQQPPAGAPGAGTTRRYRVVGNLPYNRATPIILALLGHFRRQRLFADATVMIQREVANRLLARPATKDYGSLTVVVGLHADVERLVDLPPGAFSPPPKVHSTVVRLTFRDPAWSIPDEAGFERLTKALFSQRRKTLLNAMRRHDPAGATALAAAGLDPRRRPETLQLGEIARLAETLAAAKRGAVL